MVLIFLGLAIAAIGAWYFLKSGTKVTASGGSAVPSWDAYGGVFGQYPGLRPQDM